MWCSNCLLDGVYECVCDMLNECLLYCVNDSLVIAWVVVCVMGDGAGR